MLNRAILTTTLLLALTSAARADLAPEPYEPGSPYFWVAIVIAISVVAGYFYFRNRRK
jgi:hypothetical protein